VVMSVEVSNSTNPKGRAMSRLATRHVVVGI